jgi:hypothetical protein
MILAVRIQLSVSGDRLMPLGNVNLALFDRDENDPDDFLAKGRTDERGEILLSFDSNRYTDREDQENWRIESLPDLYVVVYGAGGEAIHSTRAQTQIDKLPRVIQIMVPRELALEQGLIQPD